MTVIEKTVIMTIEIIKIGFKSKLYVLNIKNSSICADNPKLKTIPNITPLIIETSKRTKIYKNTIIRISVTETPIALNILNI